MISLSGADHAGLTDRDLAARSAAGDEAAFGVLMNRHQAALYDVCRRITGYPEDALDALQETLIRAWRSLKHYRGDAKVSTWLYRIATNAALDETQRRARRAVPVAEFPEPRAGSAPAEQDQVVGRLWLDEALAKLPPPYRAAIVLRERCGCTYKEIAEVLGIPLDTAKVRISRARRALVRLLDEASQVTEQGGAS